MSYSLSVRSNLLSAHLGSMSKKPNKMESSNIQKIRCEYVVEGVSDPHGFHQRLDRLYRDEPDILDVVFRQEDGAATVSFLAVGRSWADIGRLTANVMKSVGGSDVVIVERGAVRA